MAWLETAYGDGLHGAAVSRIRAAKPHVGDIQLRYATLLVLQPHRETFDSAFVVEPLGAGLVAAAPV